MCRHHILNPVQISAAGRVRALYIGQVPLGDPRGMHRSGQARLMPLLNVELLDIPSSFYRTWRQPCGIPLTSYL
jgi:hypothetical protein